MEETAPKRYAVNVLSAIFVLAGLYLCRLYSYPLFHSIAEIFSIVVAFGIFMVAWNTRGFITNNFFLFLGIAYPFIGAIDLIHALSYKGVSILHGFDSDLPTQLWVSARLMESLTFVTASFFTRRKVRVPLLLSVYFAAACLVFLSTLHWRVFPECYREGLGLTPFKVIAEYGASGLFLLSAGLLTRSRGDFDPKVFKLILASVFTTIASELSFTLYSDPYSVFNLIGHYLKIVSFYLIYRAVVHIGIRTPYSMIHADLKQSHTRLRDAHSELEKRVEQRTAELQEANRLLRQEVQQREKTQSALNASEELYYTLVEASLEGVYMAQDGKIVFANERFASIFGYSRDQIVGMDTWEFVHPEDRAEFLAIQKKRNTGEEAPDEYESRGLTRDGRTIWVIRRVSLVNYHGSPAVLGNLADITKRKALELELQFLSSRILSAEEIERKRIARELHDGIGQLLGAAKFRIESVLLRDDGTVSEEGKRSLQDIISLLQRTIEEIRRILAALRPSMLDDLGIVPTINWLCREFHETYQDIAVDKQVSLSEGDVPDELKTVIFRVIQESFANVAKHSRADRVRVSLSSMDGALILEVEDNGVGFDRKDVLLSHETPGIGLQSIRERTRISGGHFDLETGVHMGTKIKVVWPLHPKRNSGLLISDDSLFHGKSRQGG